MKRTGTLSMSLSPRRLRTPHILLLVVVLIILLVYIPYWPVVTESSFANERGSSNGGHVWREDGLVETNMQGPHPIMELMEKAENRWKEMHLR
jgi:hypothetical protein